MQGDETVERTRAEAGAASQPIPLRLYRAGDRVTAAAPMPGFGPDDIHITVTPQGSLIVEARLCSPDDAQCGTLKSVSKDVVLDEWDIGPYRREVALPAPVDGTAAVATYRNGILVVSFPVCASTRPSTVTLSDAAARERTRFGLANRALGDGGGLAPRECAALLAGGGALLAIGLARRSLGGALLAAAGGGLLAPALRDLAARYAAAHAAPRADHEDLPPADEVEEASRESFPASDPPAWTGTAARPATTH